MNVKELKRELETVDENDEVAVRYFDFGEGGMRDTTDVTITTEESKLIFTADPG